MDEPPVCIIPARGGSKRFPRKNLAKLAGATLVEHAVTAALGSGVFGRVYVSSEDTTIRDVAASCGASILVRPDHLATDTAPLREVCARHLDALTSDGWSGDAFGMLLTTNPLRRAEDVAAGYRAFRESRADAAMSVVPFMHPPQRALAITDDALVPRFGMEGMRRAQDLEMRYRHDGSFVFARVEAFMRTRQFYAGRVAPYVMPVERSVDVDSPLDLEWAEFLHARNAQRGE